MSSRKPKCQMPPPPPSPRILHLPRRTRRSRTAKTPSGKLLSVKEQPEHHCVDRRGKLEALFDQERVFSRSVPIVLFNSDDSERRERVEGGGNRDSEEEKWRFQAEILRAECNFLRMEREIALKKMERNRLHVERIMQSALDTLLSGRKKMNEGRSKSQGILLEKEIEWLEEKIQELQKSSEFGDFEVSKSRNFDRQASVLRRKLEKIGEVSEEKRCVREIREMAEASLNISSHSRSDKSPASHTKTRFADVEILRLKMEGLSKGMLQKMEEYGASVLSSASNSSSAASSASTSRRIEFPELAKRQQEACSGHCKAIVRKIVEHVRAETEQWTQMQAMLGQVRDEMNDLQASKDFWEDRALESDERLQTLQLQMHDWRQKALSSEKKASELQKHISELRTEIERFKTEPMDRYAPNLQIVEPTRSRGSHRPPNNQREKEKRVLICRLKENPQSGGKKNDERDENKRMHSCRVISKRLPLQEIGNSSPQLVRHSRAVFPLYSPELSNSESV